MKSNKLGSINKKLILIALALFVLTPVIVIYGMGPLSNLLCVPQSFKGSMICLPNFIPAFALLAGVPVLAGLTLIFIAVTRKN